MIDIGDGNVIEVSDGEPFRTGDAVWLSLRPEAIELAPPGADRPSVNNLNGVVAAAAYQGAFVEYEIAAAGITLKARVAHSKGKTLYQRGDAVKLTIAPEAVNCLTRLGGD